MSGGGGSKPTDQAATAATQQPQQTVQPGMPGQLDALSTQLASGYGQQPADILAYLQQFYKPMQIPDYSAKAATIPGKTPPVKTPTNPGVGDNGAYRGGSGGINR